MESRAIVAANLKALKRKYGYANRAIAKKSGVGEGTVCRAENAAVSLSIDNIEAIAAVFGLHGWQLLLPNLDVDRPQYANHITPEDEEKFRLLEQAVSSLRRLN